MKALLTLIDGPAFAGITLVGVLAAIIVPRARTSLELKKRHASTSPSATPSKNNGTDNGAAPLSDEVRRRMGIALSPIAPADIDSDLGADIEPLD